MAQGSNSETDASPAAEARSGPALSAGQFLLVATAAAAIAVAGHLACRLIAARREVRGLSEAVEAHRTRHAALTRSHERLRIEALALAEAVEDAVSDEVKVDVAATILPGMNYCDWNGRYGTPASQDMIRRLADIGIRKLVFTPTYYQRRADSTEIYASRRYSRKAATPKPESLAADIQFAHKLGMEVGLKLHIDPEDETPRGEIVLRSDSDYQKWLASYRRVLFAMVDLAKANDVAHFYVGCELSGVANDPHTESWRALIRDVRKRFLPSKPKLTFASQHVNTYNIQFWDDLDYIGVNTWPYFRSSPRLSVPTLQAKWRSMIYTVMDKQVDFFDYVRFLARTFGRPVVLTELGCQSKADAAFKSVVWQEGGRAEPLVQAYFFEAFFAALRADMARFAREQPEQPYPIVGVDCWNCVIDGSGPRNSDYTIVGKPAGMLYRKLFGPLKR